MGVTCLMDNGHLIGAHISDASKELIILGELSDWIDDDQGNPVALYMTGNIQKHCTTQPGLFPTDKARNLGFTGAIYIYDTARLNPTDGSFVRVISNGAAPPCTVYSMLDETARPYTTAFNANGHPGAVVTWDMYHQRFAAPVVYKTGTMAQMGNPVIAGNIQVINVH